MRPLILLLSISMLAFAAQTPNVVLILADDLGYGDPQIYNPSSKIPTPHIDRLASQGMRFTDAHSPSSVCTPTRYGILTGRFAWRSWMKKGVLGPYGSPLIEEDRLTLAKMLKQRGYRTACIGKWHLGWKWTTTAGTLVPAESLRFSDAEIDLITPPFDGPRAAGFDYYFGTDVPNYPPYMFLENESYVGPPAVDPKPKDVYGNPGRMQEGWQLERILPELTRRAVHFIEGAVDEPFFLYVPLTAPHTPIVPSRPWHGKSDAGDYGDLVAEVDGTVGAVMAALERSGTADNTLLIMTSDNGSPARAGDPHLRNADWARTGALLRLFGHNPAGDWRGMKADAWEGGHRVPFLVRWPGRIESGSTNDALICHSDIMATIAAVMGDDLPASAAEDSFNILPLLLGEAEAVEGRAALIHHSQHGMFAIRQGDWKLILGLGSGGFSQPRVIEPTPSGPQGQLYNLAADPAEKNNLWSQHPDIVQRLAAQLDQYKASGRTRP
jgi:arylsulfatase A